MTYDAIVLAGGLGTRLREAVSDVPKPLALINGTPFLDILLKQITSSKIIDNIVLSVGYKAEMIIDRYKNRGVIFSVENEPLGTGGALAKAIKQTTSAQVFVFNGDSYLNCPLERMAEVHKQVLTVACTSVPDTCDFGRVELESSSVKQFNEKGISGPGLINGGIYLFDRTVFAAALPKTFSLEKELIPNLIAQDIQAFVCDGVFIDIGTKSSYAKAQTLTF